MAITAESVLAEVETLAEAKAIARDMLKTASVVAAARGADSAVAAEFSARYWNFVDAMVEKFTA